MINFQIYKGGNLIKFEDNNKLFENEKFQSENEIRKALSGNLCRCTGYENIIKAVLELIKIRNKK